MEKLGKSVNEALLPTNNLNPENHNKELLLKDYSSDKINGEESQSFRAKDSNENVEDLKNQLESLTNSLAILSAEKSRMEANFQTDKKQIRIEREEYERVIKNFKEKLKKIQNHAMSEVEHLKYKLIMERHEREKEKTEHAAATKDLQKLVTCEQKAREQLECQINELKNLMPNKIQPKVFETEVEVLRNKLKQAEEVANEAPLLLQSLQIEMSHMKRKHKSAIYEEQKRAAVAEQEAKKLAAVHESRVAGLEGRLHELSQIVGGYDKLRQQDQKAINNLKQMLIQFQDNKKLDISENPQQLTNKIKELYFKLLEIDKINSDTHVKDLLNSLKLCDKNQETQYKEKFENILLEYEEFKKSIYAQKNMQNNNYQSNDETQLHRTKSHNKNLEEKLRMLTVEFAEKEKELKNTIEELQHSSKELQQKMQQQLAQKESEYLNKIGLLEQQLLRQRERSLSVIQEKDKEIQLLKSSFDALLPKKGNVESVAQKSHNPPFNLGNRNFMKESNDLFIGLLDSETNPPILHYAQELARKEVQVSDLRKQNVQLEAALRESERNFFKLNEKYDEDIKKLNDQIKRLEAYKSREGANLEYLKNVVINYLLCKDSSGKRHMLNAISTVLKFTPEENGKILNVKR